jgi:hypothetical protein
MTGIGEGWCLRKMADRGRNGRNGRNGTIFRVDGRNGMAIAGMAGIASRFAGNGREWHLIFRNSRGGLAIYEMAGVASHLARMAGMAWHK